MGKKHYNCLWKDDTNENQLDSYFDRKSHFDGKILEKLMILKH